MIKAEKGKAGAWKTDAEKAADTQAVIDAYDAWVAFEKDVKDEDVETTIDGTALQTFYGTITKLTAKKPSTVTHDTWSPAETNATWLYVAKGYKTDAENEKAKEYADAPTEIAADDNSYGSVDTDKKVLTVPYGVVLTDKNVDNYLKVTAASKTECTVKVDGEKVIITVVDTDNENEKYPRKDNVITWTWKNADQTMVLKVTPKDGQARATADGTIEIAKTVFDEITLDGFIDMKKTGGSADADKEEFYIGSVANENKVATVSWEDAGKTIIVVGELTNGEHVEYSFTVKLVDEVKVPTV